MKVAELSARGATFVACIIAVAAVVVMALTLSAQPAWANGYNINDLKGSFSDRFVKGQLNSKGYSDFDKKGNISNVKSSNTKVATVKLQKARGLKQNALIVKYKKPGKVTISYKLHGKKYKAKIAVYKYKYANPVQSLKVGDEELAAKFNKQADASVENVSGALSVKAAPGWKVKSVEILKGDGFKKVKDGYKPKKVNGEYPWIRVTMLQKKTKLTEGYCSHPTSWG